jgi:hypothetical protein
MVFGKNINYIIPIKVDSGKIETLWNNVND